MYLFCLFLAVNEMEPMALGSPVSGSTGQGLYPNQQQTAGPQYLPGYLMGDISSQVSCSVQVSTILTP